MSRLKMKVTVAAAVAGYALASLPNAHAQAVPGGTLDPLTLPKYVTPLVIPPVLYDDMGAPMGTEEAPVEVAVRQFNQQVLPTLGCTAASAGSNHVRTDSCARSSARRKPSSSRRISARWAISSCSQMRCRM